MFRKRHIYARLSDYVCDISDVNAQERKVVLKYIAHVSLHHQMSHKKGVVYSVS